MKEDTKDAIEAIALFILTGILLGYIAIYAIKSFNCGNAPPEAFSYIKCPKGTEFSGSWIADFNLFSNKCYSICQPIHAYNDVKNYNISD